MIDKLKAQLKAAIWGLVAAVGEREARRIVEGVLGEIGADSWSGPGNR